MSFHSVPLPQELSPETEKGKKAKDQTAVAVVFPSSKEDPFYSAHHLAFRSAFFKRRVVRANKPEARARVRARPVPVESKASVIDSTNRFQGLDIFENERHGDVSDSDEDIVQTPIGTGYRERQQGVSLDHVIANDQIMYRSIWMPVKIRIEGCSPVLAFKPSRTLRKPSPKYWPESHAPEFGSSRICSAGQRQRPASEQPHQIHHACCCSSISWPWHIVCSLLFSQ